MDPPRADLRLGYLCNSNCRFCCVSDNRKFNLPTDKVKQDLDIAKQGGAEKVVFTGGEPTIRKDIFELVSYAKKLGFSDILIITNGRMCSYPDIVKKLVDAGLTSICFSMPDTSKEEYEYLTQVKGSYSHLMKAIENIKKYDLQVSTITVITKLNYDYLPKITEYLIEMRKNFRNFFSELMFINPTNNAWRYRDELIPKISEVAPYVHECLNLAKENDLVLSVEAIPFCYMKGWENRVVELHMAKERVFLDPERDPDYDYNLNRMAKGKTKSSHCSECKYNRICEGVWNNYARIYGVDELRYDNDFNNSIDDGMSVDILRELGLNMKHKLLQLTHACNQRCIFCTQDKYLKKEIIGFTEKPLVNEETDKYGISTSEAEKEIIRSNCDEMTIVGGEPTLRKDLAHLIEFAKKKNVKNVIVNTNGTRLSDMDLVMKLKNSGVDCFLISLHSHTKEGQEKISGIKGNFDKTIKGIRNSLEQGIMVNLVYVIYLDNYKYLADYVDFVNEKLEGIRHINFVFIKPNDEDPQKVKHMIPKLTEIEPYLIKALEQCNSKKINFTVANVPLCFMKDYEDHNCQASELKEISGKNQFNKWMKNRLENKELDEYGYKDEICSECSKNDICIGLIKEYAELYGTGELKPI